MVPFSRAGNRKRYDSVLDGRMPLTNFTPASERDLSYIFIFERTDGGGTAVVQEIEEVRQRNMNLGIVSNSDSLCRGKLPKRIA